MPQFISSNIPSLTAQRNLNTSQNALNTSLQRLSSGLRINSAKDDAAGLAISERFTTQIRGLNQAQRNSNDGISLAQTAEGDLGAITNNLQRIRELAVQSANATNSASDRAALQLEAGELIAEIDRVAQNSEFNGVRLLDGGFATQQFQVGANADQVVSISDISSARTASLGQTFSASGTAGTAVQSTFADGDLTVNGFAITAAADAAAIAADITAADASLSATATNAQTAITFADVVGVSTTGESGTFTGPVTATTGDVFSIVVDGVTAAAITATNTATLTLAAATVDTAISAAATALTTAGITVAGSAVSGNLVFSRADATSFDVVIANNFDTPGGFAGSDFAVGTNSTVPVVDYTLTIDGTALDLSTAATDGTITATEVGTAIGALSTYSSSGSSGTSLNFTKTDGSNAGFVESGTDSGTSEGLAGDVDDTTTFRGIIATLTSSDGDIVIAGNDATTAGLVAGTTTASTTLSGTTISATDISTVAGANAAIVSVDSALTSVNTSRAGLGAIQNRFESVVSSIQTTSENLSAARSRIRDADFAEETAALTRAQILQQAGVSILSQANSLPQNVLALLQ